MDPYTTKELIKRAMRNAGTRIPQSEFEAEPMLHRFFFGDMDCIDYEQEEVFFCQRMFATYSKLTNVGGFGGFMWKDLEIGLHIAVVFQSLAYWTYL